LTIITPNQIVFKAIINVILTHDNFEWEATIVPMHRVSKQLYHNAARDKTIGCFSATTLLSFHKPNVFGRDKTI